MVRGPEIQRDFTFIVKVLVDYPIRLNLPPVLGLLHREFVPRNAVLGSSTGQTWDVRVEEEVKDDEAVRTLCFCGEGWTKFLNDWGITLGEFLLFSFDGDSTFDVTVFGRN